MKPPKFEVGQKICYLQMVLDRIFIDGRWLYLISQEPNYLDEEAVDEVIINDRFGHLQH